MAIPAYLMDQTLKKRINYIEEKMIKIEERVKYLEARDKKLKKEIEKDIHEHVKSLLGKIHTLGNEIKSLKG